MTSRIQVNSNGRSCPSWGHKHWMDQDTSCKCDCERNPTWTHKQLSTNCKKALFFHQGDVVHVSLNWNDSLIVFSKQGTIQRFEMKFNQSYITEDDEYHICVCLLSASDQIELLSPIKIDQNQVQIAF